MLQIRRMVAACGCGRFAFTSPFDPGATIRLQSLLRPALADELGRSAQAASTRLPGSLGSRTLSISDQSVAASGKPSTPAAPGHRFSIPLHRPRSGQSRSRLPIQIRFTSARAKPTCATRYSLAMVCTDRTTAARPGNTSAWKIPKQIGRIIVDPKNSNLVYVAALGNAYGPNADRGVYRTHDGGVTWEKVLFKNNDVGAIDLNFDPTNSQIIYAALWNVRRPPWFIYAPANGPGGGIFKSTNGGATWKQIDEGIPSKAAGELGSPFRPQTVTESTPRWMRRTAAFFARTMPV